MINLSDNSMSAIFFLQCYGLFQISKFEKNIILIIIISLYTDDVLVFLPDANTASHS